MLAAKQVLPGVSSSPLRPFGSQRKDIGPAIAAKSSLLPRQSSPLPNRLTVCSAASSGTAATADRGTSSSFSPAGTLYDLLGIPRTGSQAEIKDAYRQLARRFHPDVCPPGVTTEECTRRFIKVQEAYEILSDPQRRAMYDFEMMYGRKGRRVGVPAHAKATWRPRRRSDDEPPLWESFDDEVAVKSTWRDQWGRQMDGLRNHRRREPKPNSWAARMREQQCQEDDVQERNNQDAQDPRERHTWHYPSDELHQEDEECEAPCA